ncbi:hypothetical protein LAZ67_2004036 [Cordylochernes scorpioides]|uniref:Uncharacterized protein n=1 Tax=Cordylochernes scorpioides TaxID=51811 RepID=A0ABY6K554_9ARAC|nr:hypothetical protein LAZ67_2004036 [Cordylochernes scorpioides]
MDVLLVTGEKAAHVQAVQYMYGRMNKQKTSFLKVTNAGDVLAEAPEKLSHSLHLFVKGLGYLLEVVYTAALRSSISVAVTSVTLPGVERQKGPATMVPYPGFPQKTTLGSVGRRRTLSMEDYDLPRPRRTSLTTTQK